MGMFISKGLTTAVYLSKWEGAHEPIESYARQRTLWALVRHLGDLVRSDLGLGLATKSTLVAEPVLWKLGPLPLRYIHFNFSIFEFHSQLLHSIFIYTSTCRPSSFGSIKVTKGSTITEFKAVDVYEATFGPHCEAWISSCDVPSCCKFHSLGRWDYQRFLYSTV